MSDWRCTMPKKGGVCGQLFHPATGHWESETRHWCWECTAGMVVAMIHLTTNRVLTTRLRSPDRKPTGVKLRVDFYKHAWAPTPGLVFEFTVYEPIAGTRCTFMPTLVTKTAPSLQAALELLDDTHPGHGISEHLIGLWRVVIS